MFFHPNSRLASNDLLSLDPFGPTSTSSSSSIPHSSGNSVVIQQINTIYNSKSKYDILHKLYKRVCNVYMDVLYVCGDVLHTQVLTSTMYI